MNYDKIAAVRRSDLWELRKSPAHYHYKVTHPSEQTQALLFGTAAHKYMLEPKEFFDCFAIAPKVDRRTKAGKEEWKQFCEENEGKDIITADDWEKILAMVDMVGKNPTAAELLFTGQHEVPIEWTDPKTGVECKCRPDVLTTYDGKPYIVDYKTTTSCEGNSFERSCRKYGYKLQAGMYCEGVFQTTLDEYGFAFVAQEKTPPYAVRVYFCDTGFIEEGFSMMNDLLHIYRDCAEKDEWPGYEDKEVYGDEQ